MQRELGQRARYVGVQILASYEHANHHIEQSVLSPPKTEQSVLSPYRIGHCVYLIEHGKGTVNLVLLSVS